jgi:hypothetical protein
MCTQIEDGPFVNFVVFVLVCWLLTVSLNEERNLVAELALILTDI